MKAQFGDHIHPPDPRRKAVNILNEFKVINPQTVQYSASYSIFSVLYAKFLMMYDNLCKLVYYRPNNFFWHSLFLLFRYQKCQINIKV